MDHIKLTSPHDAIDNPFILVAFLFSIRDPFHLIPFGLLDIQACAKRTLFAKLVQKWHLAPHPGCHDASDLSQNWGSQPLIRSVASPNARSCRHNARLPQRDAMCFVALQELGRALFLWPPRPAANFRWYGRKAVTRRQ